jgi:hypothetical protein
VAYESKEEEVSKKADNIANYPGNGCRRQTWAILAGDWAGGYTNAVLCRRDLSAEVRGSSHFCDLQSACLSCHVWHPEVQ